MRGKIIVQKNTWNGGWCTKFHGESGQLYYADLMPEKIINAEWNRVLRSEVVIYPCSTEGDDDSGIAWSHEVYGKYIDEATPETLKKCIEEFLGYEVDMVIEE